MRVWRELDRLYAAHSDALLIDCGDDLAVEVQERAKGKKTVWRVGSRHQVRKSFSFNGSFFPREAMESGNANRKDENIPERKK